jgi:hypothetical protein
MGDLAASGCLDFGCSLGHSPPPWCGAVAQLGERVVRNDEVSGSIPLSSTKSPFQPHKCKKPSEVRAFIGSFVLRKGWLPCARPIIAKLRRICPRRADDVQSYLRAPMPAKRLLNLAI